MRRISLLLTLTFALVGCGNHSKTTKDAPYLTDAGVWVFPDGSSSATTSPGATPSGPVTTSDPSGLSAPLSPSSTPADPGTPVGLPGDPTPIVDGPPLGGAPTGPVSFTQEVQPIFTANCATCHGPAGSVPVLTTGSAYEALVNQPATQSNLNRVQPGNSAMSYLFRKVAGTHLGVGGSGSRMPANMPQLAQIEVELIQRWIDGGALNN